MGDVEARKWLDTVRAQDHIWKRAKKEKAAIGDKEAKASLVILHVKHGAGDGADRGNQQAPTVGIRMRKNGWAAARNLHNRASASAKNGATTVQLTEQPGELNGQLQRYRRENPNYEYIHTGKSSSRSWLSRSFTISALLVAVQLIAKGDFPAKQDDDKVSEQEQEHLEYASPACAGFVPVARHD
ncbi:MAG: hypothetical protein Q9163_003965 [Psora crenata]